MDFHELLHVWAAAYWTVSETSPEFGVFQDGAVVDDDTLHDVAAKILLRQPSGHVRSLSIPGMRLLKSGPTIIDVLIVSRMRITERLPTLRLPNHWTPSTDECLEAGCLRKPDSALLVPDFGEDLMKAVSAVVPDDLRVKPADTITSLVARLSDSHFLDDMLVPRKGRGENGATDRLNSTCRSQPRRVTMSVRVSPTVGTDDHEEVHYLFDYANFRRPEHDKQCRPMPPAVFDLGVSCWLAAHEYLTPASKVCPFTHCQLLIYYECFNGRMGQHRDNTNTRHLRNFLNGKESSLVTALGPEHESQALGSNVVVFSLGTGSMQFLLRFPHKDNLEECRQSYVIHERFCLTLGPGTLFVLDPWDDLYFTHEAYFDLSYDDCVGESTWREAYVFRHVGNPQMFHTFAEKHKLYMSREIRTKISNRKRARLAARARARRQLFQ